MARGAVGAVDVHPQAVLVAERGDVSQWVDAAGVHRAARRDDREGLAAGGAVGANGLAQVCEAHAVALIGGDETQILASEPE